MANPELLPAELETVASIFVDAVFTVHSWLGPGLLESACRACLIHELAKRGLRVQSEVVLPVVYDGMRVNAGYRIDLLMEDCLIAELKATQDEHPIFKAQLLTYMKLSEKRPGFLINFNKSYIKEGIQRFVL
jgi:GxxExxY protein